MNALNKLLNYLIVLAILTLSASFFYVNDQKQKLAAQKIREQHAANPVDPQLIVNKYLQEVGRNSESEKLKLEKALLEARLKVKADVEAAGKKEQLANQAIPREKQIWKEEDIKEKLGANEKSLPKPSKPNPQNRFTRPDDSGGQDIDISKLSPEEKKEYAKQYIENARKGGYYIELSDDLQVIKATPIRKPSQQSDTVNTPQTD